MAVKKGKLSEETAGVAVTVKEKAKKAPASSKKSKPKAKLDELFRHLCASEGLFSKDTFLALYGSMIRLIRDQRLQGIVLTRPLGDDSFASMATAMENMNGIRLFHFNEEYPLPDTTGIGEDIGFLLVLTDRLCAFLHWSSSPDESFRMYDGGWTFHPSDVKTISSQLVERLEIPELSLLYEETQTDRRYDEKLTMITRSLVQTLENRNRDLTMALDRVNALNKKILETERLAAIGQLCSVIAHEIRNPLGLIDLYAKLVEAQTTQLIPEQESDSPQVANLMKNISLIRQATESLETILSELTNYSRPLQLREEPTDIVELTRDVCDFYRPSYTEKNIELEVQTQIAKGELNEDGTLILSVDQGRIRQALINLLKNALEASPEKTRVLVTVACRNHDDYVYIKVTDQGRGVTPETKKKLFTPYFSTKKQGTGLGLAHVRKTLQAHGGNAEMISSVPDEATTFALILPRHRQQ